VSKTKKPLEAHISFLAFAFLVVIPEGDLLLPSFSFLSPPKVRRSSEKEHRKIIWKKLAYF